MILLAFLLLAGGVAQAEVGLAGDWKLNASRSDLGGAGGISALTMKNTHVGAVLKCSAKAVTGGGEIVYDLTFTTDGKESVNQAESMEMRTTAVWEGDTLVMNTKSRAGSGEIALRDKWSLSSDGKTLTIQRRWTSSRGEMDQKLVLEKQ